MKKFFFPFVSAFIFIFASCSPELHIKAKSDNSVDVTFKTGFSEQASKSIKKLVGVKDSDPLFSPADMIQLMTEAGARNVSAKMQSENDIQASGSLQNVKNTAFYATGIIKQEEKGGKNVTSISIGPNEIQKFYSLLDENTQAYVDTMMIPCLIGETMSENDYKLLLSTMYGPTFANELVEGTIVITLEDSNGKKKKFTERLGSILTMTTTKTWTID